jgi:hypothetical protein
MRKTVLHLLLSAGGFLLPAGILGAATLQVGPGQTYAKPCAAIAVAAAGDTILIDAAGSYAGDVCYWFTNNLTLRGINGRPHIDAAGKNAGGKGIWVIAGDNNVVENIEFSGATVPDGNGAGIRFESFNVVIRHCYFHNNQDGILTDNPGTGDVLVEYSEFANNGSGDGKTHNIYIGDMGTFTLRFSYSHNANKGHLVKSRAAENHILYNRLTSETGTTSYELDIPNGGLTYVIGNLIEQGANDANFNMLAYLEEGLNAHNPDHELFVSNNTFVNDKAAGTFLFISANDTTPAVIQNNIFKGAGTINAQTNSISSNNLINVNPLFVNQTAYNYHLLTGSPAINAGMAPGTGAGQSLSADYDYVHPECGESRTAVGAVDIGAYEFGNIGVPLTCTTSGGTGSAALSALTINPSTVTTGQASTATVTLTNPAPPGGIVVTLSSSKGSVASVPTNVSIAAGNSGASAAITTGPVTTSTAVTLSAVYSGVTKTANITVNPVPVLAGPALSGIAALGVTSSSAVILWGSTAGATSQVNYGDTSAYGSSSVLNSSLVQTHIVSLSGLSAGHTYHFQVVSKNAAGGQTKSGDFTFTTTP